MFAQGPCWQHAVETRASGSGNRFQGMSMNVWMSSRGIHRYGCNGSADSLNAAACRVQFHPCMHMATHVAFASGSMVWCTAPTATAQNAPDVHAIAQSTVTSLTRHRCQLILCWCIARFACLCCVCCSLVKRHDVDPFLLHAGCQDGLLAPQRGGPGVL